MARHKHREEAKGLQMARPDRRVSAGGLPQASEKTGQAIDGEKLALAAQVQVTCAPLGTALRAAKSPEPPPRGRRDTEGSHLPGC